jgi:3-dehydroquinate dehydratase-2
VLVLSGPNLDRLGTREPSVYGTTTLPEIHIRLAEVAREQRAKVVGRQSNHEGDLVGWIGGARGDGFDGIVINPAAYSHTSIAILDALRAAEVPAVEVHLSNPDAREPFRRRSLTARACIARVAGFGARSYELGLLGLLGVLSAEPRTRERVKAATPRATKGTRGSRRD